MTKLMNRKLTKKGFTLAELLIVVAIIAILVAIAAPLFVGALDDANDAVKKANIRAVKSAAVAQILLNPEKYNVVGDDATTNRADKWVAYAKVDANGNITWDTSKGVNGIVSVLTTGSTTETDSCKRDSAGTGYDVVAVITALDITAATSAPAGS